MPRKITTLIFTRDEIRLPRYRLPLALELANDQNHRAASKHWRGMTKSLPLLVTTSYVFDEVVTFFNNRGHHAKAVEVGNRLLNSPSVQLVHVDEALFREGWHYLQQHGDKEYSVTDCISFVLMKRLDTDTAFAFDKHFVQAGLRKLP
jgi:predicted nucleic acid-binding protein